MQVNKITCGSVYNASNFTPKRHVNVSQNPTFEGQSFKVVNVKPANGLRIKIKKLANLLFPKNTTRKPWYSIPGLNPPDIGEKVNRPWHKIVKNKDGKVVRKLIAFNDSKSVFEMYEYSPKTGKRVKHISFMEDGKSFDHVSESDPQTGKLLKLTQYQTDGKTPSFIKEFEPGTQILIKDTTYRLRGKTKLKVFEFKPEEGYCLKETHYRKNGTISKIERWNPYPSKRDSKTISYNPDGTIDRVEVILYT